MVVIESAPRCTGTPIAVFGLEEAGCEHEVIIKEDGWFLQTFGEAGPRWLSGGEGHLGWVGVRDQLSRLPGLLPEREDDRVVTSQWLHELNALRPVLARARAAASQGQPVAEADQHAVRSFLSRLEHTLTDRSWLGGARPGPADVSLTLLGMLARAGVPLPPRTRDWLERLQQRPAWIRTRNRFPAAAMFDVLGA